MTNNLLDEEGTGIPGNPQENPAQEDASRLMTLLEAPIAPEPPAEEKPQPPAANPAPEAPKTVFAPAPWERSAGRQAQREARDQEKAAREAQREAQEQEKAAQREAKLLEKKIAQEQRKAQEDQRRQEARDRAEERRQEARRRAEERQEEKAKQRTVRRVGTMTLGVSLIAIGAAILAYMFNPGFDIRIVAYLAPVILIGLGLEVLIRSCFSKDRTYKFDFASGILCVFLVLGSFCVSLMPYVVYYIGPERFTSEEELLSAEREKLYQAFRGDQRVERYYLNGGIDPSLTRAQRDENDRWIYQLSYLRADVFLLDGCDDEAAFAQTCRELLDKLMAQGFPASVSDRYNSFGITFDAPENADGIRYRLNVENRLQLEMTAGNLEKLVTPIYTKPTTENGWFPAGYEEIEASFGGGMADHFADLMENYSVEDAGVYYTLLMENGYPAEVAERYYFAVIADNAPEPLPEDDTEGEVPPETDEGDGSSQPQESPEGDEGSQSPAADAESSQPAVDAGESSQPAA